MTRKPSIVMTAVALGCLTCLICTKIPGDMSTLNKNIGATSLLSPADASTDNILSPKLVWGSVIGATRYSVQVSTASDFSTLVFEDTAVIDTNKVAAGLNYKTIYYWRVQVHDPASSSDWTTRNVFTTIGAPAVPVLSGPPDTMMNAPLSLVLSWKVAGNAMSYWLQVSSDSGFVNLVEVDSMLADTSKPVSNLSNSTTYFWRVRSQNPGGVSAWTTVKRFSTIVAAPKVPTTVSPANGATGQQLSLSLVWNQVPQASWYSLQLSTDVGFAAIIFSDSTVTDTTRAVSGLANGVLYYWRVKAKNIGGVSAWSSLSGFTTVNALPQQPVLISPEDNAVNQPIPLTLTWNRATGAAQYYLQIATDSAFSALTLVDSAMTDTFKTTSGLLNDARYYWRVRAKNPTGASAWTLARSFTTFAAALGTPVLLSPSSGAVNQALSPVLTWGSVSGAKKYQVEVSTSSGFSSIIIQDTSVADTSRTLAGLANNTTYYWHVRASNATGFSNWTIPWSFTTIMAAPQTPRLLVPSDDATGQQLSLTLIWDVAAGAATYTVQVAGDSNFAAIIAQDSLLTDTSKSVAGLSNGTTYYWHVKSKNAAGGSAWSAARSFTTFAATLSTPVLTAPQNGATGQSVTPTLTWSLVTNATAYEVQVATANDFTALLIDNPTLTAGTITINGLANSGVYYWRVRAKSLSGAGNWTDPWSFTTIITTPAAPVLVSPADKAPNQPVALTLTWNKAVGAAAYYIVVAGDTGFVSVVSSDSTVIDTVKSITGLLNGTTYYWKVKGRNASGYGDWSGVRSFTTIVAPPATPVLSGPGTNALNVPVNLTLTWKAVTGAAAYCVQLSTSNTFATIFMQDSTLTTGSKAISGLLYSFKIYWRVNATNIAGTSAWATDSFTTVILAPSAPSLTYPVDVSGVPLNSTLSWGAESRAVTYRIQVASASDFSSGILLDDSTLTATSKQVSLPNNATLYYWRVNAKNAGGTSDWTTSKFWTVKKVTLTLYATNGTVNANPVGPQYDSGTYVTLTAGALPGYRFKSWSGGPIDGTTYSSQYFTISASQSITANFVRTYSLTIIAGTGGTIYPSSSPVTVDSGIAKAILAYPNTSMGFNFAHWTVTNGTATIADVNSASTTVSLTSGNAAVTANFTIIPAYTVTDTDGNVYHAVLIGTQVWMVENLKTTRYNDGTPIPLVTDSAAWVNLTTPGYCWYNDSISYGATYGALYNWYTVNTGKLAPKGWHVPSAIEWFELCNYLGGSSVAGGKLKETGILHWASPNTGATNDYGFTALPGGYRDFSAWFILNGSEAFWWDSTASGEPTSADYTKVDFNSITVTTGSAFKQNGYSIRCIRDQ